MPFGRAGDRTLAPGRACARSTKAIPSDEASRRGACACRGRGKRPPGTRAEGRVAPQKKAAPEQKAAPAESAKLDDAQRRFQRGIELYKESDFDAALVEFKRAYELVPSYKILYNLGQVSYQRHDYASALRYFRQYLEEGGDGDRHRPPAGGGKRRRPPGAAGRQAGGRDHRVGGGDPHRRRRRRADAAESADPRQQRPPKGGGGRPQRRASHPSRRRRRRRDRARELPASRVAAGGASPAPAPPRHPGAAAAAAAAASAAATARPGADGGLRRLARHAASGPFPGRRGR